MLVGMTGVSLRAQSAALEALLAQRLALAETIAAYVEHNIVGTWLARLETVAAQSGIDPDDGDMQTEMMALSRAYQVGNGIDYVFITDVRGVVIAVEPHISSMVGVDRSGQPHIRAALETGSPQVSDVKWEGPDSVPLVSLVVPITSAQGETVGLLGAAIDPAQSALLSNIAPGALGESGYAQLIDSQGRIIASTFPGIAGQLSEHADLQRAFIEQGKPVVTNKQLAHSVITGGLEFDEVLAFAPISSLGWGVSVEQDRDEVMAPLNRWRRETLLMAVGVLGAAVVFTTLTTRQVTRSVLAVASAARRVAEGDLETPLPAFGRDEIGQLGNDFEGMRSGLREARTLQERWHTDMEEKVVERTRRLESLQTAIRRFTADLSLESTVEAILQESRALFGADRCAAFMLEPETGAVTCIARHGVSEAYVQAFCAGYQDLPGGLARAVAKPVIVPDAQSDPRMAAMAQLVAQEGFHSLVVLPFVLRGVVAGAFALYHDQRREYSAEDIALGEAFAAQAAIAVENARLFQRAQQEIDERLRAEEARLKREQEREAIITVAAALRAAATRADMLPIVLDQLLELLPVRGAALAMHDPTADELVTDLGRGDWSHWTGVRLPAKAGLDGQEAGGDGAFVVAHSDWQRADLLNGLTTVACTPLFTQEQRIGALWVGRVEGSEFGAAELRLLAAIGDMVANAVYRATLHEQTEQQLQYLDALHAIDVAISSSLDLRVTLNVLLDRVMTQPGVAAADVLLYNDRTQDVEHIADRGFRSNAIQRTRLHIGEGLPGRAILERRVIKVSNPAQSADCARAPLLAGEAFDIYYGAPLFAKGKPVGVLEVFGRAPIDPDTMWVDFLETLATEAAIAIDNATLFDDLQRSNIELTMAYDATIEGWARALELRDSETEGHSRRVTDLTLELSRALGMDAEQLVHVRRGALLHDIGKMGVPDAILLKPGPLDDKEWAVMRMHPVYAYDMLRPVAYLRPALDIPYAHHERWDGSGYPNGLQGEQIPLAARAFAIVDVWDALRTDRPYHKAWSKERTLAHLRAQSGKHFDPRVVEAFLQIVSPPSTPE
ncbi:MAG: GAF domain-containing protein [Anaerolineales bacterium]